MTHGNIANDPRHIEMVIIDILKEELPELNFEDSDHLIDDALIDSFDIVMLITAFEKVFKINIPGEEILPEHFMNIATMAHLVCKLRAER